MAAIEKITGKNEITFRITVSGGFDTRGKRIRHRTTYKPTPGMTDRQMQKAAQRAAADFERSIELGFALDNRQTFSEYAAYVLELKQRTGTKQRTLDRYKDLMRRLDPAIGHIKLVDLRPQHLNALYKSLAAPGQRETPGTATPRIDIAAWLKKHKISRAALAGACGVGATTVSAAAAGRSIREDKAALIARAMGLRLQDVFTVENDSSPLADGTVLAYHRLISLILTQAEKEMLVPYNAAAKATPPPTGKTDPNYFQPDVIGRILSALEQEPLKWQLITHLLIVTGCRRGEIAAIKWDKIDFDHNRLVIDSALIVSPSMGVYESTTKTGDVRYLTLPAETMELLKQHRLEQMRLQLLNGDRWIDTGYIFTTDRGEHINPDSITSWLAAFSIRHDLPHINPHAFRHTVASVLLGNGTDIVTVAAQLGHSSTSTTENFYAHIIEENKAKASECIADVLLRKRA